MPIAIDLDHENVEQKVKDILSSTRITLQGKGPLM